jgi:hypothetical protein
MQAGMLGFYPTFSHFVGLGVSAFVGSTGV